MTVDTTKELPPFPDDVPTHALLVIDYEKLKDGDKIELDTLWKACTELGFFYLKNHGVDIQGMWDMGEATMALPLEEKMKFEQGNTGRSLGYKAAGTLMADANGNVDTIEFMNVSKDDACASPPVIGTYPSTVETRMPAVRSFTKASEDVMRTMVDIMSDLLGLPREVLRERHDPTKPTGSESRVTRNPPRPQGMSREEIVLGAHTDFGSLSVLHNVLGGLQVLVPGSKTWQYIKPLPGHAICNIGDALTIYSGGVLRSNMHRVIPPPGEQAKCVRWSLVYFFRPASSAILEPLTQSPIIATATQNNPLNIGENVTAGEWFARRVKYHRAANRKGPESWEASRGTEHLPSAV